MKKPPKISRWLKDADYLRSHLALRKWSDERSSLLAHVRETGFFQSLETPAPRILSVGCGSGVMDIAWLEEFAQRGIAAHYLAVEPNLDSLAEFQRVAAASLTGGVVPQLCAVGQKYEDYHPAQPLDRIMFMHSLYHFPDREATLRKALAELAPGGSLMVCVSDDEGLPKYKTAVYQQIEMPAQSQYFPGSDLRRIVEALGCPAQFSLATVNLEVTECLQLTPDGIALLDFFFLCRFEALTAEQQQTALTELPLHCHTQGDRCFLKQPTLFVELTAEHRSQPSAIMPPVQGG